MSQTTQSILASYPDYEATIGIEVHVQLKTQSKLFCGCANRFGDAPNTNICQICAGHPGSLPVLNRKAVEYGLLCGLAVEGDIAKVSTFARKHYIYPDLPKNFQVTQGDHPICENGYIPIDLADGTQKKVRLMRIHMEEDAGKNIHATETESFVDLNRAGTPLLEIVSMPDITNADEARAYLMRLRALVQYLGVSNANMEEGSFRADTNVSVKKKSDTELGTRVELKNINSFKFIGQAIEYELKRQLELITDGGTVDQETRLWDTKAQKSVAMRSKEDAQDYRYFTEPDIPELVIDDEWLTKVQSKIPELPHDKYYRFQKEYGVSGYEAEILTSQTDLANFFEETTKIAKKPKQVSNWMLRDLLGHLKENKLSLAKAQITPEKLAELVSVIEQGVINTKVAQDVFAEMITTGKYPSIIIQEQDLKQISSSDELEKIAQGIIDANPQQAEQYRSGKDKLFGFFVGQTMKETKGKGNPQMIQDILKKLLK